MPLKPKDPNRPQRDQGLYQKFDVKRTDGRDQQGGDRQDADYIVLDLTYDKHAFAAAEAYVKSVESEYPELARELSEWLGVLRG